ncbi:3-hydroxyacyl-CoA dehydrogenase/enoyl-CoA hydratase family protein [Thermogymnomonas acidicola]|nr:3-hydroxyacyl-CoA dehydrogenase NAD-binding domain-containing protein [Thermogymnomonas acidicola]
MPEKAAVIGAGTMGHGIAEVFALAGYHVGLTDAYPEALEKAKVSIRDSLSRLVKSSKITQEAAEQVFSRISFVGTVREAVEGASIVIEAVPEIEELKKKVFSQLDELTGSSVILASNTSNIRITSIAEGLRHPERVVGMHFFNPPVVLKLVEVIKGEKTSDEAFENAYRIVEKIGKTPIRVMKDTPGFVVNRVNAPESLFFCLLLEKGMAKPEEVDAFARGQGLPMGPYELMDYVGIDTVVHSLDYYARTLSPDYGKCRLFHSMVEKGMLGAKTGRGFYEWKDHRAQVPKAKPAENIDLLDVLALEVNEAVKLIEDAISSPEDIEAGVKLGMNRPFGPISVASSLTNAEIRAKLQKLHETFGVDVFAPAKSIAEGRLREIIQSKPAAQEKKEERAEAGGGVGTAAKYLKVDRPSSRVARIMISNTRNNLINHEVLTELEEELNRLWNDREVVSIIITGEGKNTSAGAQLTQYFSGPVDFMEASRKGERVYKLLQEIPKITIAEMKGYTLGGGFELSLSCDLRVASEDLVAGFPEVTLGLVPGWSGSQRLARLVGISRAMQYILTGDRRGASELVADGLIYRVFPPESVDEETVKLASELASRVSPVAAAAAKRLVNRGADVAYDSGLEMEAMAMGMLYGTEDLKEGISAFLQKRKPEFKGR